MSLSNGFYSDLLTRRVDRWQVYIFDESLGRPELTEAIAAGQSKIFNFVMFAREIFHRLYARDDAKLEQIKPEALWASNAHDVLDTNPEWSALQQACSLNPELSIIATAKFCQVIAESLPECLAQDPEPIRAEAKFLQEMDEKTSLQSKVAEGKQNGLLLQEFANSIDNQYLSISGAVSEAQQEVANLSSMMKAIGFGWGNEPGQEENGTDYTDCLQAIRSSELLKLICKISGRLQALAASKRREKTRDVASEICEIEMGNNLTRLLPSELIKLTDDDQWLSFAKGYCDHSLLQYRVQGKAPKIKGPMFICVDSSSSMAGARDAWAKAVALTLLRICYEQKRDATVLFFNTDVASVHPFKHGEWKQKDILHFMGRFYKGGTAWQPPLNFAIDSVQKEADIILITDGKCKVDDDFQERFNQQRASTKTHCFGILIGDSQPDSLMTVCDKAIAIPDLSADGNVGDLFKEV